MQLDSAGLRKIITEDEPELLVDTAKKLGESLVAGGLTTSQIRNIFGAVRVIQSKWSSPTGSTIAQAQRELELLKPKLSYQAARHKAVGPLEKWLVEAITLVRKDPNDEVRFVRFGRFVDFFEAVLAYHTASGGKQEEGRR